jgi:hypothetical protein
MIRQTVTAEFPMTTDQIRLEWKRVLEESPLRETWDCSVDSVALDQGSARYTVTLLVDRKGEEAATRLVSVSAERTSFSTPERHAWAFAHSWLSSAETNPHNLRINMEELEEDNPARLLAMVDVSDLHRLDTVKQVVAALRLNLPTCLSHLIFTEAIDGTTLIVAAQLSQAPVLTHWPRIANGLFARTFTIESGDQILDSIRSLTKDC